MRPQPLSCPQTAIYPTSVEARVSNPKSHTVRRYLPRPGVLLAPLHVLLLVAVMHQFFPFPPLRQLAAHAPLLKTFKELIEEYTVNMRHLHGQVFFAGQFSILPGAIYQISLACHKSVELAAVRCLDNLFEQCFRLSVPGRSHRLDPVACKVMAA